jgi:hypothetical protein
VRALDPPGRTIQEALSCCITGINDKERLLRFVSRMTQIAKADVIMRAALAGGQHNALYPSVFAAPRPLTAADMKWLYDQRMVQSARGREIYDEIKLAAAGECPLCGQRDVTTLDHYYPKATWPALAVSPTNLVPSCLQCNTTKNATDVRGFHPYFDELGTGRWLVATLVEINPLRAAFHIQPLPTWPRTLAQRTSDHFRLLRLSSLYAQHAGSEMRAIRRRLERLQIRRGVTAVREHLEDEADSRLTDEPNSWRSALYETLASTSAYYTGGFLNA